MQRTAVHTIRRTSFTLLLADLFMKRVEGVCRGCVFCVCVFRGWGWGVVLLGGWEAGERLFQACFTGHSASHHRPQHSLCVCVPLVSGVRALYVIEGETIKGDVLCCLCYIGSLAVSGACGRPVQRHARQVCASCE